MTGVCGVFILVDVVVFSDCDCDGVIWYCIYKSVFVVNLVAALSTCMLLKFNITCAFSIAIIIMYAIMFVL